MKLRFELSKTALVNYRRVAGQGIQAGFLCIREVVAG
jgi:hypothetical protein